MPTNDREDVGTWFGGSMVRVILPQDAGTLVGRVHGSTGFGRVRIIVEGEGEEKDTSLLIPRDRVTEVVEK